MSLPLTSFQAWQRTYLLKRSNWCIESCFISQRGKIIRLVKIWCVRDWILIKKICRTTHGALPWIVLYLFLDETNKATTHWSTFYSRTNTHTHTTSRFTKKCIRTSGLWMGVKESHPSSISILRRDKLSTITTSCPWSDKCNDVGQPQNPSPPKTITFFFVLALPAAASPLGLSHNCVVVVHCGWTLVWIGVFVVAVKHWTSCSWCCCIQSVMATTTILQRELVDCIITTYFFISVYVRLDQKDIPVVNTIVTRCCRRERELGCCCGGLYWGKWVMLVKLCSKN